ncbi:adenylate/guanylate cyclase domain-containing protein [Pseudorhodobacter turbinis]|uniref:Adenylate/guanylate cyclase domain-containing protein n=1 Tax=Pseudorhodobacter turbinis TaxID=2500533 RepID=A0A4P8EEQ8_9RHOB|nr:adenylate/guanylate cyclase domain-containing protein [Pseudorhodobacter turbinis]QCO55232.1 adenylate/guanylate cyclase domain-containing protein [Pseudorhodobacter turbinis]
MALGETFIASRVDTILGTTFNEREGRVVPTTDDVTLKDGAVKINATFLYADLAGSANLSDVCPWNTTAKIIRAFLEISTRLIVAHGGAIRSFDGDRVMGVFIGGTKNTSAALCGREIHWSVRNILAPKAKAKFESIRNNSIEIRHCVGIDTGDVRAVRSGVRDHNDLIWIGRAASFSAKLSDLRDPPYHTYISSRTYGSLLDSAKLVDGKNAWTSTKFTFAGKEETVYKSNHWKKP